jgi:hypothetical protein
LNYCDKDYFAYIASTELFVDKLIDFINQNIAIFPAKKTTPKIEYLGSSSIFYKSNNRTTWYIFFEQKENDFIITNIININSQETKWL